jgi:hypothetical protein
MRQIADTLVWLAMIMVIAGVIYFTPRLANYVTTMSNDSAPEAPTLHGSSMHLTHDMSTQSH